MTGLFAALLAMTLAGTLAALAVFALKKSVGDRLSPAFGCYIWLPVLLLFLLPAAFPLPEGFRMPLDTLLVTAASQEAAPPLTAAVQAAPALSAAGEGAASGQVLLFSTVLPSSRQLRLSAALPLLALWLGGALFAVLVRRMDYRRVRRYLAEHSVPCGKRAQGLFDRAAEGAGLSGKVETRLCPGVGTPLVIGFFKPVVYLPHEDFSRAQLELIFAHELTHLQYRDHWFKALALGVSCFQWWNPVAYALARDLDYACEICCDQRVTRFMDSKRRKSYGHMLLELAAGNSSPTALTAGFAMDRRSLQRRLKLVLHSTSLGRGKQILAVALAMGVTSVGLVLSAALAPAAVAATSGAPQSAWEPPAEYFQQLEQSSYQVQPRSRVLSAVDDRSISDEEQLALEEEALEALGMETTEEPTQEETPAEDLPENLSGEEQEENSSGETQEQIPPEEPDQEQPEQTLQEEPPASLPEGTEENSSSTPEELPPEEMTSEETEESQPSSSQQPEQADAASLDNSPQTQTVSPQEEPEAEEEPEESLLDENFSGDFIWPVDGGYIYCGYWGYYGHNGVDIAADVGTDIYAAADGIVTYAQPASVWPYGKNIIIDHGGGYQTRYAHCSSVLVEEGQQVSQGKLIALVGRTGNATGPHCHFEVIYKGVYQNPSNYIGY